MVQVDLATEDELSEAVGVRLLAEIPGVTPGLLIRRGGNGYLRSRLRSFCEMARNRPVLVLTDLDTYPCPSILRKKWFGRLGQPPELILRVAVQEVEAWILADHLAVAGLIGKHVTTQLPPNPDAVSDPKSLLLRLARRAPRDVRLDLCSRADTPTRPGLGYTNRLCEFVNGDWEPRRAAERSKSLRSARGRLRALAS